MTVKKYFDVSQRTAPQICTLSALSSHLIAEIETLSDDITSKIETLSDDITSKIETLSDDLTTQTSISFDLSYEITGETITVNYNGDRDKKNYATDFIIDLGLPNIEILDTEQNELGDYIITLTSTVERAKCRRCGQHITYFHQFGREIILRDLPILGDRVFIKIRAKQYKCQKCHLINTQKVEWYLQRSPNTIRYEEYILRQLINSTISDISRKEDLSYGKVVGIMERHLKGEVNWDEYDKIPTIGIDEISILKGHKKYYLIITAKIAGEVKILAVLPNRKKKTLKKFLIGISERLKDTVKTVCTDMYEAYINAVEEVFNSEEEKVKIVIDRFHVAKSYRKGLEDVRRRELKRLKKELTKKEYKRMRKIGWLLRIKPSELTDLQREKVEELLSLSDALREAYNLTYELTKIFDDKKLSKEEAQGKIKEWMGKVAASSVRTFDKFIETLKRHWQGITNYFLERESSGFVEGLNNKLKVIKRQSYGIKNTQNFFRRIYLSLEGYALFA